MASPQAQWQALQEAAGNCRNCGLRGKAPLCIDCRATANHCKAELRRRKVKAGLCREAGCKRKLETACYCHRHAEAQRRRQRLAK